VHLVGHFPRFRLGRDISAIDNSGIASSGGANRRQHWGCTCTQVLSSYVDGLGARILFAELQAQMQLPLTEVRWHFISTSVMITPNGSVCGTSLRPHEALRPDAEDDGHG
jgi:hypothetical protein